MFPPREFRVVENFDGRNYDSVIIIDLKTPLCKFTIIDHTSSKKISYKNICFRVSSYFFGLYFREKNLS